MPFKSKAQRAKFGDLVKQGKMPQSTFDEWNEATKDKLPERIGIKKPHKANRIKAPKYG